jgi:hypothetical protein
MDGVVSISALPPIHPTTSSSPTTSTSNESYTLQTNRPARTLSLPQTFSTTSSRPYITGGMAGVLTLHEKGWGVGWTGGPGHRKTVVHSGEGPIWSVRWSPRVFEYSGGAAATGGAGGTGGGGGGGVGLGGLGGLGGGNKLNGDLIAWANERGVKIWDRVCGMRIGFVERPGGQMSERRATKQTKAKRKGAKSPTQAKAASQRSGSKSRPSSTSPSDPAPSPSRPSSDSPNTSSPKGPEPSSSSPDAHSLPSNAEEDSSDHSDSSDSELSSDNDEDEETSTEPPPADIYRPTLHWQPDGETLLIAWAGVIMVAKVRPREDSSLSGGFGGGTPSRAGTPVAGLSIVPPPMGSNLNQSHSTTTTTAAAQAGMGMLNALTFGLASSASGSFPTFLNPTQGQGNLTESRSSPFPGSGTGTPVKSGFGTPARSGTPNPTENRQTAVASLAANLNGSPHSQSPQGSQSDHHHQPPQPRQQPKAPLHPKAQKPLGKLPPLKVEIISILQMEGRSMIAGFMTSVVPGLSPSPSLYSYAFSPSRDVGAQGQTQPQGMTRDEFFVLSYTPPRRKKRRRNTNDTTGSPGGEGLGERVGMRGRGGRMLSNPVELKIITKGWSFSSSCFSYLPSLHALVILITTLLQKAKNSQQIP